MCCSTAGYWLQPLYWDDARQYFFATENSLLKIWLNQTGYAYYRPALFTFYKFAFTYLTPSYTAVCYAAGLILQASELHPDRICRG